MIDTLRKENETLKETNGKLNTWLAQKQLKYFEVLTKLESDVKEKHQQVFNKCKLCEITFLEVSYCSTP